MPEDGAQRVTGASEQITRISGFYCEYRWLSNFWYAPITLYHPVFNVEFTAPTNEHAYQALKAQHVGDFDRILTIPTPAIAKRMGRLIEMRPNWDRTRLVVMWYINHKKYDQHWSLRRKLIETGDALLEESNTWGDTYWGVCNGVGENHLGKLLMRIRADVRKSGLRHVKAV